MHNARLNERAPFLGQVDVVPHRTPNPDGSIRVWGQDVSETGMFLQTTHPFRAGDTVSLRFDVEEREVHVRAAEVVWVRPFEPVNVDGQLPGVGLRFVSVDPPARAALRVLTRTAPRDTLVDGESTLPAPKLTLPPLTQSILARAQGRRITQEMISLAPFSELPVISLPPDDEQLSSESRVFDGLPKAPRTVTMGPQEAKKEKQKTTQPMWASAAPAAAPDEEDAFAGWTFKKQETLPEAPVETPAELSMRFSDEPRPAPHRSVLGDPSILELSDADFSFSLPPEPRESEMHVQIPMIEERIHHVRAAQAEAKKQKQRPRRSMTTAAAFLMAGCCAGAVIGLVHAQLDKTEQKQKQTLAAAAPPAVELPALAPIEPKSVAEAEAALAPPPPPKPVEIEKPVEKTEQKPVALASTKKKQKQEPLLAEPGKLELDLSEGGKVKRVFALASPSRVVVDLVGATLPKKPLNVDEGGVMQLRFGHPDPKTERVVIIVAGQDKPAAPTAKLQGDRLVVGWSW